MQKKKGVTSACLRVSRLLKRGIFTGCVIKIRITFKQNQVLVTWKTQRFTLLESKT